MLWPLYYVSSPLVYIFVMCSVNNPHRYIVKTETTKEEKMKGTNKNRNYNTGIC